MKRRRPVESWFADLIRTYQDSRRRPRREFSNLTALHENVWVQIPLDEEWLAGTRIVVMDDGNGMTRAESAHRYLEVGGKRRKGGKDTSAIKCRD